MSAILTQPPWTVARPTAVPIETALFVWHLYDTLTHHSSHHWRQWLAQGDPAITHTLDIHATSRRLYQAIWAHAADPLHQTFWTQHFREALRRAMPQDPPSWKRWMWQNPDAFPLEWQAAVALWRIPEPFCSRLPGWWNAHTPLLRQILWPWLTTTAATEWSTYLADQAPRIPTSPVLTQMQRTIYTLKEERDTAVQNFQAVLQTIPEPTAPPAKPSTAYRDLLLPYRFDVIGLYSRRTTYHRVIESMHGTLSKFWEGMDDRVPDRLSADAVIIDATHVHHSTLHRVVYPTEKIFLADPSGLALREALIRWATHLSPEQEVPLPS